MSAAALPATRPGLMPALAAYGFWGLVPLYFKAVAHLAPTDVLAHRVVWSFGLLAGLLTWQGSWKELADCLRSTATMTRLVASTLLIAVNWFAFLYAVSTGQVLQASLGHFITPLVSILLGLVVLRERLRGPQWLALGLAALGVAILAMGAAEPPWIALIIAASFGTYGLLRKTVAANAVIGLSMETLMLAPLAIGWIAVGSASGHETSRSDWQSNLLLLGSGVVTTVPMLWFVQAARQLQLSTLGIIQYLSPSLSFLLAVSVFGESFSHVQMISFGCIWVALVVYSVDLVRAYRRQQARSWPTG